MNDVVYRSPIFLHRYLHLGIRDRTDKLNEFNRVIWCLVTFVIVVMLYVSLDFLLYIYHH